MEVMLWVVSESSVAAADLLASVFFLQKSFAILLLQQTFRLTGAKTKLPGKLFQRQILILI